MSSQLIRESAMQLFTEKGFEGTSLADIAEIVGIKKSSIYNHYKSKDELFLYIFESSNQAELLVNKQFFTNHASLPFDQLLKQFIDAKAMRFSQVKSSKFLLRFINFPPFHLKELLKNTKSVHSEQIKQLLVDVGRDSALLYQWDTRERIEMINLFMLLIDGILVDIVCGQGDNFENINSAWASYSKNILRAEIMA